ncbi:MAG TPA: hypothetical protein VJB65_02780, partial [Patescibacteria group bacterium]|nr:hypothetical protein [Patescibacteria group bacterium]
MKHLHLVQFLQKYKPTKVVLLYHWDADGLASAALMLNLIADICPKTRVVLMHPSINHYFLKESEYQRIEQAKPG